MQRHAHIVAYDLRNHSPAQPRVAALIRELQKRGTPVFVWSAHQQNWLNETENVQFQIIKDHLTQARIKANTEILSLKDQKFSQKKGHIKRTIKFLGRALLAPLSFPDTETTWSLNVALRLYRQINANDLVMTFSRPESVGLIGIAAKQKRAFWWSDFADGWCYEGLRSELMRNSFRRSLESRLEKAWINSAHGLSTVNTDISSWFKSIAPGKDIFLYPNIVPNEFAEIKPRTNTRTSVTDPIDLGYFGRLSQSDSERCLAPLLWLLTTWKKNNPEKPNYPFNFHFWGNYSERDLSEIHTLEALGYKVFRSGFIERKELAEKAKSLDALMVISSPGQSGTTSKLLDAIGLNLPVFAFANDNSHLHQMVKESGLGEVINFSRQLESINLLDAFVNGIFSDNYRVVEDFRDKFLAPKYAAKLVDALLKLG